MYHKQEGNLHEVMGPRIKLSVSTSLGKSWMYIKEQRVDQSRKVLDRKLRYYIKKQRKCEEFA